MRHAAGASIVRVHPVGASLWQDHTFGGFVYPTGRHVVAYYESIDAQRRGVWVSFYDGHRAPARLVAADKKSGLVLFELEGGAHAPPLELSERPLKVGDEAASVALVGPATPDGKAAPALKLLVGRVPDQWWQAGPPSLTERETFVVGATAFDCEGKVVALRWGDTFVPAQGVRRLFSPQSTPEPRAWRHDHMHMSALAQLSGGRAFAGIEAGTSAVYKDRLELRFGGDFALSPDAGTRRTVSRLQFETSLGYRFMLSKVKPFYYIVPRAGAAARLDFVTDEFTRPLIKTRPCPAPEGGACEVTTTGRETRAYPGVLPAIGVSVHAGWFNVGYQHQVGIKGPLRSVHQVSVGWQF